MKGLVEMFRAVGERLCNSDWNLVDDFAKRPSKNRTLQKYVRLGVADRSTLLLQ